MISDSKRGMDRRRCLQAGVAGLAMGIVPRGLEVLGREPEHRIQFGLVTYLWGQHMDLPTLLSACQQSGLRGVELRTEHKHGVEPKLTAGEREAVREQFGESGITLVGYGSNCEFHSPDAEVVRRNIEACREYIRLSHDCGGTGVKVKPNALVKDVPREKTIEQIGKALNELASYAEGWGQQIRVEVHGSGTSDLRVIRDIFAVADHPNVGVCWNSNPEDLQGDGLEANFKMVQKRLGATCHVRELDQGDYPYEQLLRMLLEAEYDGWVLLEARTDPADKVAAMVAQREVFERFTSVDLSRSRSR